MADYGAVFERIPDRFVEVYRGELLRWGALIDRLGYVHVIELAPIPGKPVAMNPDPTQGRIRVGVTLVAEPKKMRDGRTWLEISPATETDEELIRRHVEAIGHMRTQ